MAKVIGAIDGGAEVKEVTGDDLIVKGNGQPFNPASIDGGSTAWLESAGSITLEAKIDGGSQVTLIAEGAIVINGKIDNPATRVQWKGQSFTVKDGVNGGAVVQRLA